MYNCKATGRPCPFCTVTKGQYHKHSAEEIAGMERTNPEGSLIQGSFPLLSRCFVDPLHLGTYGRGEERLSRAVVLSVVSPSPSV